MDWTAIRAALGTLVATLAGAPALWRDEPRPFVQGPYVLLNVIAASENGVSEVRWAQLDDDGDEIDNPAEVEAIRADVGGLRRFTLSVQPETLDQRGAGVAMTLAEHIRSRLSLPTSLAALKAAGLALVRCEGSKMLDYQHDNRAFSRASLDVILATASNESDAPTDFIETILLTSEITDEAGNLLPSPPNVTDLEVEVGP